MTFCSKCGKENPEQAAFCNACGTPLSATPTPLAPTQPAKSEYASLLKILLALAILAVVFYVVFALPIPCTIQLPFSGVTITGHATIWQMLTGGGGAGSCSYP